MVNQGVKYYQELALECPESSASGGVGGGALRLLPFPLLRLSDAESGDSLVVEGCIYTTVATVWQLCCGSIDASYINKRGFSIAVASPPL